MTRLLEWLDTDREKRIDTANIIDDQAEQVLVYRVPTVSGDGFSAEITDETFYKRMVVRIDKDSYREVKSEAGDGVEYDMVAIAMDEDIRMSDKWVLRGKTYQIVKIDDTNEARIEVFIKQYRDET